MKNKLLVLIIAVLGLANTCFGADQKLSLKAGLSIPGAGKGGFWDMSIEEYGEAGGAKFILKENDSRARIDTLYKTGKIGKPIVREVTLSKGEVAFIEIVIKDLEFFSIKKSLASKFISFHRPIYRIGICLGEKCHFVELFHLDTIPVNLLNDLDKFKTVWNFLWDFVKGPRFTRSELKF